MPTTTTQSDLAEIADTIEAEAGLDGTLEDLRRAARCVAVKPGQRTSTDVIYLLERLDSAIDAVDALSVAVDHVIDNGCLPDQAADDLRGSDRLRELAEQL